MLGISMGGLMSYYMSTKTKHLNTLIPLISSPNFLDSAYYTFSEEKRKQYKEKSEEALTLIESMDPSKHVTKMQFKQAIIMNGRNDEVIPIKQTNDFVDEHPDLPIIYRTYDAEHKITKAMHEDLINILKSSE